MNAFQYYAVVLDRMKNCFQFNDYTVATGKELIAEGCDAAFPALVMSTEELHHLTVQRGLQVHIPVVGTNSQSVLMPLDFEIFLSNDNYKLYSDKESQRHYFKETIPVIDFVKKIFMERGMPFLLDYTPSGGHILFQNPLYLRSTMALAEIGYLENDLIRVCETKIPGDLRRRYGISREAASVFSGLGKMAEYISLLTMKAFENNEAEGRLPVTISDAREYCINLDNSWSEGSPHMRSIRSPFSLHKKNQEKYNQHDQAPLVDVIGACYDGEKSHGDIDIDQVVDCMWDLEKAAAHAQNFSGYIPCANETLIDFIEEYKSSDLYLFHKDFDAQDDIPQGKALEYAKKENNIPDWAKNIVYHPNPMAVQPINMIGFIYDFVVRAKWHPKHVANILRDMYVDPANHWVQDFHESYPAEEKANFWTRTYAAIAYWRKGWLNI